MDGDPRPDRAGRGHRARRGAGDRRAQAPHGPPRRRLVRPVYPPSTSSRALPAAAAVLLGVAIAGGLQAGAMTGPALFQAVAALVILAAGAYLVWNVEPAYILCAGIALSPLSGNWRRLGLPSYLALDRVLLLAAVGSIVVGAVVSCVVGAVDRRANRPPFPIDPINLLLLVTTVYATVSAFVAGTLFA